MGLRGEGNPQKERTAPCPCQSREESSPEAWGVSPCGTAQPPLNGRGQAQAESREGSSSYSPGECQTGKKRPHHLPNTDSGTLHKPSVLPGDFWEVRKPGKEFET